MLADIKYWENDAQNKHYAIAHFNVWNAEMLMGVIDARKRQIRRLLSPLVPDLWAILHLKTSLI